jgi:hypothetical protein
MTVQQILALIRVCGLATFLLAVAVVGIDIDAASGHAGKLGTPTAVQTRNVTVNDVGKLSIVGGDGNLLVEEGRASGTLPGNAHVTLDVSATSVASSFTIYVNGGSMSGHGSGKLHSGNGRYESFGGAATINHGTGRYAHVSGAGGFYGVLDRRSDDAEVQVIGKLRY